MDINKVVDARFMTAKFDKIAYLFETKEGFEEAHETYDMSNELCAALVDKFGHDKLKENYELMITDEAQTAAYVKFVKENWNDINNYVNNIKEERKVEVEVNPTLQSISKYNEDTESLFKLKLEIFELPEVKESTNRQLKTKIRKSKNCFEIFGVLHELMEQPDNE